MRFPYPVSQSFSDGVRGKDCHANRANRRRAVRDTANFTTSLRFQLDRTLGFEGVLLAENAAVEDVLASVIPPNELIGQSVHFNRFIGH